MFFDFRLLARSSARVVRDAFLALAVATLLSTLVGQLLADRVRGFAPLMYLPAALIAIVAAAIDLTRRGRTLRGPRGLMGGVAAVSFLLAVPALIGLRPLDRPAPGAAPLRLLQWNVMWGGAWDGSGQWTTFDDEVVAANADLIVLSEVPHDEALVERLRRRLGPGWQVLRFDRYETGYVCRIRVLSRWPMKKLYERPLPGGSFGVAEIESPRFNGRLAVVDGISNLLDKRTLLESVADALAADPAIAVACGDFNATSRSVAFDRFAALGFRDAGAHGRGWRATWPAGLPVYDIDHVLVGPSLALAGVRSFGSAATDHRGRVVELSGR
ncbi:MAG TPA: endonuclease/exonuclease/phosphatase family protein [Tepidisphaeraceae bacterium]